MTSPITQVKGQVDEKALRVQGAAIQAAAEGWEVFPVAVENGKKRPLTPNGHLDATNDPLDLLDLDWSEANAYGIRPPAGMVIIDVDVKHGDGWAELPSELHEGPATRLVKTPSGGAHLYFHMDGAENGQPKLSANVDTRTRRGWVVGPGCAGYELVMDQKPAALPPVLEQTFRAKVDERERKAERTAAVELDTERAIRKARMYLERNPSKGAGEDEYRFKLAATVMDFGVSPELCLDLMHAWNEAQGDNARQPADIDKAVQNAAKYRKDDLGCHAAEETRVAHAVFGDVAVPVAANDDGRQPARRFVRRTFGEARTRPAASWLVPGFILDQGVFAVYGPPKGGKTFAAIDLALSAATGRDWLGVAPINLPSDRRKVVYLALEGHDEIVERCKAWEAHHGRSFDDSLILIDGGWYAHNPEDVDALVADVKGDRPGLLVIDTTARASVGLNENSASEMSQFVDGAERLARELGCVVCMVHHTGKDSDRGMRGSNLLLASVTSAIEVGRKGSDVTVEVDTIRRGKEGAKIAARLVSVPNVGEDMAALDHATLTMPDERAQAQAQQQAGQAVSTRVQLIRAMDAELHALPADGTAEQIREEEFWRRVDQRLKGGDARVPDALRKAKSRLVNDAMQTDWLANYPEWAGYFIRGTDGRQLVNLLPQSHRGEFCRAMGVPAGGPVPTFNPFRDVAESQPADQSQVWCPALGKAVSTEIAELLSMDAVGRA